MGERKTFIYIYIKEKLSVRLHTSSGVWEFRKKETFMWPREIRKGFLKEVCTGPGFEEFHGEKTELEVGKQSGVCRSMTESTSGADEDSGS